MMMNKTTEQVRQQQLYALIELHPHRDELLELIQEQLSDIKDTLYADTSSD